MRLSTTLTGIVDESGMPPRQLDQGVTLPPAVARFVSPLLSDGQHQLFAVIDGAAIPNLRMTLETNGAEYRSLWQGSRDKDLEEAAPLLVQLSDQSRITRAFFSRKGVPMPLWDSNSAILMISAVGIDELRGHLRRMTMLRRDDGSWLYFRFYSPSTLHGLKPLLLNDLAIRDAFRGSAIRAILYQPPLRNQLCVVDFGPKLRDHPVPTLVATEKLIAAAASCTPLIKIDRLSKDIEQRLSREDGSLHKAFLGKTRAQRFGMAKDLWRAGILDERQAAAVVSIMLMTGVNLMREPAFFYATRNPFLAGPARGRQLITAYQLISNAKGK